MAKDSREPYNYEVERVLAHKQKQCNPLGHFFMWALLLLIIALYIKNNFFLYTPEGVYFPYLLALALPVAILVALGTSIIYQRYLAKLRDSHRLVFV